MRSDLLFLSLSLLFVWEVVSPAQSRNAGGFGGAKLTVDAAHLKLKPSEWRSLYERKTVTRSLAGGHSKEMAGFAAVIADATPEEFVKAFSSLSVFKRSETTFACGRFSARPVIEDLAGVEINDKDLYALMRARAKESDIKLTEPDLARIRAIAGPTPYFSTKLKSKLAYEYKQILLDKAVAYAESGETSLDVFADQEETVSARDAFAALANFHARGAGHNPRLFSLLGQAPRNALQNTESFLYWALQKFGQMKPVISLVHVVIYRENDRVFIASKQIYSSHYTEAGLSVAELIPFSDEKGAKRTLAAYTIRLQVDLLGGSMGFIKRRAAQPRMLETLKTGLEGLRQCAELLMAEQR
jgi:hypothetical protein